MITICLTQHVHQMPSFWYQKNSNSKKPYNETSPNLPNKPGNPLYPKEGYCDDNKSHASQDINGGEESHDNTSIIDKSNKSRKSSNELHKLRYLTRKPGKQAINAIPMYLS